jgi:hypothetical protein
LTDCGAGHTIDRTVSETTSRARLLRDAVARYSATEQAAGFVKLSVSLPADIVEVVRATAAESGTSVSATIAAALRRTLSDAEQTRLDAALEADRDEGLAWTAATAPIAADLINELEW